MSQVEVVLFVKGKGFDASSFRPQLASQWWNRRDALVRCVAAFLFGPGSAKVNKSLVLLFDEDWSRIHLELVEESDHSPQNFVPTEQNVIGILRKVAEAHPGTPVSSQSLRATLILSGNMKQSDLPCHLDNKRSILEYLQKNCSIEFLREHGLNSSAGSILKKTNKTKLCAAWTAWIKEKDKGNQQPDLKYCLDPIVRDLLKVEDDNKEAQTITGVLHESGDSELPVWDQKQDFSPNHRVVLFLGAVRDMLRVENECLAAVCREKSIPLVKIRLGSVPEFTSKILTVVAFHAANGVIWPGIQDLVRQNSRKRPRGSNEVSQTGPITTLEVVCFVPIETENLVADLNARTRILWCLVRCCVVTLWRSKIHASTAACPLVNRLRLVFTDGVCVSLQQDELVAELAEQHQAAPCEHQILVALRKRVLDAKKVAINQVDWSKVAKSLLKKIRKESPSPFRVVSTPTVGSKNYTRDFYGSSQGTTDKGTYVLMQTLGPSTSVAKSFHEAFSTCFTKKESDVVVMDGRFCDQCEDMEAASITMMQHIAYQGRMKSTFGTLWSKEAKADVVCGQGEYNV